MWMGPFAYGSALVTRIFSAMDSPRGRRTVAARLPRVIGASKGAVQAGPPRCYGPDTMCTLLILRHAHPEWPLILAANRDELLDRPASGPQLLPGSPRILVPG